MTTEFGRITAFDNSILLNATVWRVIKANVLKEFLMRAIRQPDLRTSTRMTGPGWEHGARGRRSRWQGRVPIIVLRTLILAVLGAAFLLRMNVEAEENSNAAPSAVERFKRFISSPPVIKNLVFQQKVPMEDGARPLDGSFAFSTRYDYFQAEWQPDGILFRRLSGLDDATNFNVAGQLISWSSHQHTLIEPSGKLTIWDDQDPSTRNKHISVFYTTEFMLEPLREVMNLGIMYAGIGTIRWTGNRFVCEVERQDLRISGNLISSGGGPPEAMKVTYVSSQQTNEYVLRYGYAPGNKYSFLPTVITNFWVTKPKGSPTQMELDQWRILDLRIADGALPSEAFSAVRFTDANNKWESRIYTNGAIYNVGTNGILHYAYPVDERSMYFTTDKRRLRVILHTCWASMNVAIFALMVGAKDKKREQPKTNKNML